MASRFVIVHRTYDPIQADHLGDILRDAGLAARVNGTRSGAAIGVGQNILEVHIAVPEDQAGQAADFLEAYFAGEGLDEDSLAEAAGVSDGQDEEPIDRTDDGDDDRGSHEAESPPNPLLAAGAAFLTFGMGHVAARRPWTGAAIAAGQLVALYFLFGGSQWSDWTTGAAMLGALVACDMVGAVLSARAHARGVRSGASLQSAIGIGCVCAAVALAMWLGPQLADPSKGKSPSDARAYDDPGSLDNPLEQTPNMPGLTSEHPANPLAR